MHLKWAWSKLIPSLSSRFFVASSFTMSRIILVGASLARLCIRFTILKGKFWRCKISSISSWVTSTSTLVIMTWWVICWDLGSLALTSLPRSQVEGKAFSLSRELQSFGFLGFTRTTDHPSIRPTDTTSYRDARTQLKSSIASDSLQNANATNGVEAPTCPTKAGGCHP